MQDITYVHKAVPEHRIHQQFYRNTRKNGSISLVRQCQTSLAVNALATGVSVTVYTILSMETATPYAYAGGGSCSEMYLPS